MFIKDLKGANPPHDANQRVSNITMNEKHALTVEGPCTTVTSSSVNEMIMMMANINDLMQDEMGRPAIQL